MLRRFERAVERMVDTGIARVFRLRVQPAEIGRQLERAMLDGRASSVGTTLAPNLFQVHLHPEDAAAFAGWQDALCGEMETWLAELAFARGLATVGPIRVRLVDDPAVPRRSVRARARFSASREPASSPRPLLLIPADPELAWTPLAAGAVTVGRAADNDLLLLDPEVSRHHARLEPAGGGWRVVDLESTNGTWVNGDRVRRVLIAPGDELSFGGTRFTVAPG